MEVSEVAGALFGYPYIEPKLMDSDMDRVLMVLFPYMDN
jgi:hypothetical protein